MRRDSIYTRSEREDLKYTIGQALASARRQLLSIRGYDPKLHRINVTCIGLHADLSTPITLEKLNEIASTIVDETLYWNDLF